MPAADADALADAMRRFVDDPSLVATMHAACHSRSPSARSPTKSTACCASTPNLCRTAHETAPGEHQFAIGRVLFVVGIDGAPLRYRAFLPAEALVLLGVHADVRYYRDVVGAGAGATRPTRSSCTACRRRSEVLDADRGRTRRAACRVVYDVDDLIFDPGSRGRDPRADDPAARRSRAVARRRAPLPHDDGSVRRVRRHRRTSLCAHAAAVTGLPSYRFANGVGLLVAQQSDAAVRKPRTAGPLRIGYLSGTNTHDHDWAHGRTRGRVDHASATPTSSCGSSVSWRRRPRSTAFAARVKRIGFTEWTALPKVLRDLDVNLAPLTAEQSLQRSQERHQVARGRARRDADRRVADRAVPRGDPITGINGLLATIADEWLDAIDVALTRRAAAAPHRRPRPPRRAAAAGRRTSKRTATPTSSTTVD